MNFEMATATMAQAWHKMVRHYVLASTILTLGLLMPIKAIAQCEVGEIVVKFGTVISSASTSRNRLANLMRDAINRQMQGKFCVQILSYPTLYNDQQVLSHLASGDIQLAAPKIATLSEQISEFRVFGLPFAFPDFLAVERFSSTTAHKLTKKRLSYRGVMLYDLVHGQFDQLAATRQLVLPSDVLGMRFLSPKPKRFAEDFSSFKVIVTDMAENELAPALVDGRIVGVSGTWADLENWQKKGAKLQLLETNHLYSGYAIMGSTGWFSGLHPKLRNELNELIGRVVKEANFATVARDNNKKRSLIRSGAVVRALTRKQRLNWTTRMSAVWSRFLDNADAVFRTSLDLVNRNL